MRFIIFAWLALLIPCGGNAQDWVPATPASEFARDKSTGLPLAFCAEWDPEFSFRGARCCSPAIRPARRKWRSVPRCSPQRAKGHFCDEMLPTQKQYIEQAEAGKFGDLLTFLGRTMQSKPQQAFCSVNNGFLVNGRPLVETSFNRIQLRSPHRCTRFGTDPMIGLLEWIGHRVAEKFVAPEFSKTRLLVGDIAAPRGGCLASKGGRRGHASHTNGQDVDIGFLVAKPNAASPEGFTQKFDAPLNGWLIKQIMSNPHACVKVIFLDRKLIRSLSRAMAQDPEWPEVSRYIRHVKFHKNHLHVRIGDRAGKVGCGTGPSEYDEELEADDDDGAHPLDPLDAMGISF